ncbi:hypothetical protein GGX14DRAFT_554536 [Mycena pura]|uniref:Uncharacterized protein n=1 Tax=Mycena pura TaxID=153505 RepID=A0AAD6YSM5_9AGAR|nr:hypothetical protein GGX14DRAFT_554536 [Mycena pura]
MTSDESYGALANQLVLRSESKLSMDLETLLPYDGPLIRSMLQEQKDLDGKVQQMEGNGVKVGHASWPWMDKLAPLAGHLGCAGSPPPVSRLAGLRAQIVGLLCAPHARSPPALLALLATREGPRGGGGIYPGALCHPPPPRTSRLTRLWEGRAGLGGLMPPTSVLHLVAHEALGGRASHGSMLELFEAIHLDDLTTDFVPDNHAVPRAGRRATRSA